MKKELLRFQNITYTTKGNTLLQDIDFSVFQGQKVALLGHNGAGKSTLIDILTDAIRPTSGNVIWYGNPKAKMNRYTTGVIFDELGAFLLLTAGEVINYFKAIYGIKDAERVPFLVERLDFEKNLSKQVRLLSKGERKKLWLLLAVIHRPEFLIMDEATAELDPQIKRYAWENVILEDPQRSLFFTTHSWDEAQQYADAIIFLSNGRMVMDLLPTEKLLSEEFLPQKNKIVIKDLPKLRDQLNGSISVYYENKGQLNILTNNLEETLGKIRLHTSNFSVVDTSLMDVYALAQQKNEA